MPEPYRFAECELQLDERRLLIAGNPASLGGRAFDVLRVLIERRARPVPKDELLDAVWPGLDVEEGNLPVHISALRKLLGPQAIATVPGRGYRFTLPLDGDRLAERAAAEPPAEARRMSNLPLLATPLLGRDDDLAALERELPSAPLLSLVGAGGIGKTRLALALAQRQQRQFADGVWWVDLAELTDADALVARVAAVTDVPVERAADPLQVLVQGLRHRRMLVLLDNAEHLVEAVAGLVHRALGAAIGVHWIVTSIEPLRLPLERVLRLSPLALPPAGTALAAALQYGALALLDERARAADRRYALTDASLPAAIDICRQLDGLPLAIEMAAARLPWMGVQNVRARLDDRLRLLAASPRDPNARHRSLQAALDWSHALLSSDEAAVFRRLAAFHGSFTLDAVPAVAGNGDADAGWETIDALGALVDKSLVHVDGDRHAPQPRYRLLESTRLYARERLQASGADADAAAVRHAAYYAALAEDAMRRLWHETDRQWLAAAEPERANLAAALDTALERSDAARVAPLYEALAWTDTLLAGGVQVLRWNASIESLIDAAPASVAARLLRALAQSVRNSAPARAVGLFERSLEVLGEAGDPIERYRASASLSVAAARSGHGAVAAAALARTQALLDARWPPRLRLLEADAAGFAAAFGGDPAGARPHFQRFHALATECGAEGGLTVVAHNLADIALSLGDADEAARLGRGLVARLREQRNAYQLGFALGNLCAALTWSGDEAGARDAAREALPLLRREQHATWLFDHLALLAVLSGRYDAAARLVGHADARRQAEGSSRDLTEQRARDRALALIAAQLDACALQAQGARMTVEEADRLALAG